MNEQTSFGLITTIKVPFAIQAKGSCWSNQGLLLANYVYSQATDNSDFKLVYTIIDQQGQTKEVVEDKGTLPCFFISPNKESFVSVVMHEGEKDFAFCKPVFSPNEIGFKTNKDFKGRFIGTTSNSSIFYEVDLWKEAKTDTMRVIHFEDNTIVKETKVAIALPKDNKVCVTGNTIQLITEIEQGWLHREIDQNGKELRRRVLEFDIPFVHEALALSFEGNSYLLCEEDGEIGLVEIDEQGQGMYIDLFDIKDEFFGTWHPQKINQDTTAVQFTTEFGNGWLVVQKDSLLELFYNKNKSGYTNVLNKEVLNIDNNDLVLSSISPIEENKFGIVFYPRKPRKTPYDTVFVLQRNILEN
ncbi:hypothetical protein ACYSNM_05885 [Myroides sp. LJL116]